MYWDNQKCRTCLQVDDNEDIWGTVPCPDCGLPLIWDDGKVAWEDPKLTKTQRAKVYAVYDNSSED